MALSSLPAFQRALLKRHAQTVGRGQPTRVADISAQHEGQRARRLAAFEDIALQRRGRIARGKEAKKDYKLRKKKLAGQKAEMPWRVGLGLGTSALATYLGAYRRKQSNALAREQILATKRLTGEHEASRRAMLMGLGVPVAHRWTEEEQ